MQILYVSVRFKSSGVSEHRSHGLPSNFLCQGSLLEQIQVCESIEIFTNHKDHQVGRTIKSDRCYLFK